MRTLSDEEMRQKMDNKKDTVRFCCNLPKELKDALDLKAFMDRTTKGQIVSDALAVFLEKELSDVREGKIR